VQIDTLIEIIKRAGKAVLEEYHASDIYKLKEDGSPLTKADLRSHHIISQALLALDPTIPIISEEDDLNKVPTIDFKHYWLIDPLDGTKEFLKKNDEFTINIALLEDQIPVLGLVYAPALNLLYYAQKGRGAYKIEKGIRYQLPCHTPSFNPYRVVISRSHPSKEIETFIQKLKDKFQNIKTIPIGSSLKLCLVAEGLAECYPRFGPTMHWDTAAAHAIILEAGKQIYLQNNHSLLTYSKTTLLNPWFIVR